MEDHTHGRVLRGHAESGRIRDLLRLLLFNNETGTEIVPSRIIYRKGSTIIARVREVRDGGTSIRSCRPAATASRPASLLVKLHLPCRRASMRCVRLRLDGLSSDATIVVKLVDAFTNEAAITLMAGAQHLAHVIPCLTACGFISMAGARAGALVLGRADAGTVYGWKKSLPADDLSTDVAAAIIFQVAVTLSRLQRTMAFVHHDLHDHNVMLRTIRTRGDDGRRIPHLRYVLDGVAFRVPNVGLCATLIDFQFSSMVVNDIYVGRADMVRSLGASRVWSSCSAPRENATPAGGAGRADGISGAVRITNKTAMRCGWSKDLFNFLEAFAYGIPSTSAAARLIRRATGALRGRADTRPRDFIMRVFCGVGKCTVADFRETASDAKKRYMSMM